jgi:hypothetical protein
LLSAQISAISKPWFSIVLSKWCITKCLTQSHHICHLHFPCNEKQRYHWYGCHINSLLYLVILVIRLG